MGMGLTSTVGGFASRLTMSVLRGAVAGAIKSIQCADEVAGVETFISRLLD